MDIQRPDFFDPVAIVNWIVEYILIPIRPYAAVITAFYACLDFLFNYSFQSNGKREMEKFAFKKKRTVLESQSDFSEKWTEVEKNINSTNPSDWRVAIVDADIMLGTILTRQGYRWRRLLATNSKP